MKKSIFNQPLNLDVLTEISKVFPKGSVTSKITFEPNQRFEIPYGVFTTSISLNDFFAIMDIPFLWLDEKLETLLSDTSNEEDSFLTKQKFFIMVIHIDDTNKILSICDKSSDKLTVPLSQNENYLQRDSYYKQKNPRFFFTLKEIPKNILVFIPNDQMSIECLIARTKDGGIIIDYIRTEKPERAPHPIH